MQNYANIGSVNGPATGTSGACCGETCADKGLKLIAVPAEKEAEEDNGRGEDDETASSKLLVGPAALRNVFPDTWRDKFGPYWVVAVGESITQG